MEGEGEGGGGQGMDEPEPEAPPEEESTWPPAECPDDGPTSLFLSADDSNSQASPVVVRRLIRSGRYVPAGVVRTYEFLDYADSEYEAPDSGLAITPELRASEDGPWHSPSTPPASSCSSPTPRSSAPASTAS